MNIKELIEPRVLTYLKQIIEEMKAANVIALRHNELMEAQLKLGSPQWETRIRAMPKLAEMSVADPKAWDSKYREAHPEMGEVELGE